MRLNRLNCLNFFGTTSGRNAHYTSVCFSKNVSNAEATDINS